jgi:hypothetical protein
MVRFVVIPLSHQAEGVLAWADTKAIAKVQKEKLEQITGCKWKITEQYYDDPYPYDSIFR